MLIVCLFVCVCARWMYLDDQNLCVQTSSSFVYGAVAIGASIYVVGDLDTGEALHCVCVRVCVRA